MPLIGSTSSSFYMGMRNKLSFGTPAVQFYNGNFQDGFNGWDLTLKQVSPGAVITANTKIVTQAAGCPIPDDPTPYPIGHYGRISPGQSPTFTSSSFTITNTSGGPNGNYALLKNKGNVANGLMTVYGPMLISQNPVIAEVGDRITFNWTAKGGGDAYNVLSYIIDPDHSCRYFILVDETGDSDTATTPWQPVYKVINPGEQGNYYFVFICGTFDYSGGKLAGSELGVDEIQLQKAGTWS